MESKLVRCFCVMACLSAAATAQVPVPGWVQLATTGPSARADHAMAYDSLRGKLVLFGGWNGSTVLGDTWAWDGTNWIPQIFASGPPARSGHAIAYDSQRHRVVLFGGFGPGGHFGDAWEWDGTNWIPQLFVTSPSARRDHAMAFDSVRARTVMFGGHNQSGVLGDTWEWDGTSWTLAATSGPPARAWHAMAFDSLRARTVLFGGNPGGGDTWEWDGTTWTQFAGAAPPARSDHTMAFDGTDVLLFGGYGGSYALGDTWVRHGTSWSQVTLPGPGARSQHAMAYDGLHNRTLMFGGWMGSQGLLGDTWEWTSINVASAAAYGAGCGSPSLDFQPNPAARPILGQVGRATITNAPTPAAAVMIGLSNQSFGAFSLPVTLVGLGMPGCDLWQSAEFLGLGTTPLTPSTLEFALPIPNVPEALGFRCYLQSYAFAPGQNPMGIIVSNGIAWRVGAL